MDDCSIPIDYILVLIGFNKSSYLRLNLFETITLQLPSLHSPSILLNDHQILFEQILVAAVYIKPKLASFNIFPKLKMLCWIAMHYELMSIVLFLVPLFKLVVESFYPFEKVNWENVSASYWLVSVFERLFVLKCEDSWGGFDLVLFKKLCGLRCKGDFWEPCDSCL